MIIPTPDDRPLVTQTAAPPVIPPRRPIVGIAMAEGDWRARLQEQQQQLADALRSSGRSVVASTPYDRRPRTKKKHAKAKD